jgi:UPF0176 protein
MYQVLLYYKYIPISHPEKVRDEQRTLCEKLGLKGRIIVANEGINGTVEGTIKNTEEYILRMNESTLFKDMAFKKSGSDGKAFPRLRVRVRPEIVTSGVSGLNPNKVSGKYITSDELYSWFEEKKEFYIVDMRNDYEYASGYFEGFIPSGMSNFYDLKDVPEKLKHLKDKTIVTVCTGGVRCEKASGILVEHGFSDVYQLKDGIQTFMEKYPNKYFKGKLYVFDNRITVGFNTDSPEHEIVGRCMHCGSPSDTYVNCEYNFCHLHYICCKHCRDKDTGLAFCKPECKTTWLSIKDNSAFKTA